MSSVTFTNTDEIRKRAEACGGEYYTHEYATVENPLSIHEKEKYILEIRRDYLKFKREQKLADESTFKQLFMKKFINTCPTKKKLVTFTLKTIFDQILQYNCPTKVWDALLLMIQTKKKELDSNYTELEKDKAVESMQNELFNSSLKDA